MTTTIRLTSVEQAQELLDNEQALLIFKHSTRCPISGAAHGRFYELLTKHPDMPVPFAVVLVVEDRPVSSWLAERLGVVHASPQVILVSGGRAVWHTSHMAISEQSILEALKTYSIWEQA